MSTVAEVIGFEPRIIESSWCNGVNAVLWSEPTVDDMLAWLDAQGYAIEMTSARNEGERDIYGTLNRYRSWAERGDRFGNGMWESDGDIEFEGPTLHAALEAAVRAVSGLAETPESNQT